MYKKSSINDNVINIEYELVGDAGLKVFECSEINK